MFLLDLSHTSHTRARTGIQRVTRSLNTTLETQGIAITWDPYARHWRTLNGAEKNTLTSIAPSKKRGAHWPIATRIRGHWQALRGANNALPPAEGVIVPEIFSPAVYAAFSLLPDQLPRVALFHDAIALKLPELTPPGTVTRFPSYMQELLTFNGIAAVSEDSRLALLDYWHWLGLTQTPPLVTIPLGIDLCPPRSMDSPSTPPLTILCVGSIEGRKNHLALLEACESLWKQNRSFQLHLIGMAHATTGKAALRKINELKAAGFPLNYSGAVDEETLQQAYRDCTFTVYPSILEGFGLPVLESLQRGKPCICSAHGALGESARPGGALMLDQLSPDSIAQAIDTLIQHPQQRDRLSAEARGRSYRSWTEYTSDLLGWIRSLN
jgi:glycosyltransferase involved in cell wall biosynthesis